MIELHGGKLAIESEPGHGTTVIAYFPAARIVNIAEVISMPPTAPPPAIAKLQAR
jgi:hypothetical protein